MSESTLTRHEEIRQIHRDYANFYTLFGGVILVAIGIFIGWLLFSGDSGYGINLYTEAISVGLTIFVLNVLQEHRDKKNRIIELQEELIRQAGSPSFNTAITAIDILRKRGWLGRNEDHLALLSAADLSNSNLSGADLRGANLAYTNLVYANLTNIKLRDATLEGADLYGANLEGADLHGANLKNGNLQSGNLAGTDLKRANLRNTDLRRANLEGADLGRAVLEDADLKGANLEGADLYQSNLSRAILCGAYLVGANFQGANLNNSDLRNANLESATLESVDLSGVLLPDAEFIMEDDNGGNLFRKYWTPDTDMTRYTDPNHPDFWQPDWVKDDQ